MIKAVLDPQFQPMAKVVAEFQKNVKEDMNSDTLIFLKNHFIYPHISIYKI